MVWRQLSGPRPISSTTTRILASHVNKHQTAKKGLKSKRICSHVSRNPHSHLGDQDCVCRVGPAPFILSLLCNSGESSPLFNVQSTFLPGTRCDGQLDANYQGLHCITISYSYHKTFCPLHHWQRNNWEDRNSSMTHSNLFSGTEEDAALRK